MKESKLNNWSQRVSSIALSISVITLSCNAMAAIIPTTVSTYHDDKTGLTLVVATTELSGLYEIEQQKTDPAIAQIYTNIRPVDEDFEYQNDLDAYYNQKLNYTFLGLLHDSNATQATISLKNHKTDATETMQIDLVKAKAQPAQRSDFTDWSDRKLWQFRSQSPSAPSFILKEWVRRSASIYGDSNYTDYYSYNQSDRPEFSLLSLFGGQTAINETLQTEVLNGENKDLASQLTNVNTIHGVEVAAHDYDQMLDASQKDQIKSTLSKVIQYVPQDRFMILLKEPKQVAHLFDNKNSLYDDFIPLFGNGAIDYSLLERYSARFGLELEQVKQWFSGKSVAEVAIFTPDIFFLDNTDITAVIRLKDSASSPFKLATKLPDNKILPFQLPHSEKFYLATQNDLLILSSNENELKAALEASKTQTGLSNSTEFLAMNHQLPMSVDTKIYAYLSDPFIRRLTSPEIKIGQLRRSLARQSMESIIAMSLLYRFDQGIDAKDITTLMDKGYLSANDIDINEYTLLENGQVESKTWGNLNNLKPLSANPVEMVNPNEVTIYEQFREQYTNYWKEFFDPIAIRGDLDSNGLFSIETFIFPLIDNSLYNSIRGFLDHTIANHSQTPIFQQAPLALMSFNIPEHAKQSFFSNMRQELRFASQFSNIDSFIGNDIAIAIQDSAPILQTQFPGLNQFEQYGRGFFGTGADLIVAPIFGAYFTRPTSIALSVKDEAKAQKFLQNIYFPSTSASRDFYNIKTNYDQNTETLDASFNVLGVIRMDISAKLENGWLHISNSPWKKNPIINTQNNSANHLFLAINSSEAKEILPQLDSIAKDNYTSSAEIARGELYPWMTIYQIDAEKASQRQKSILGSSTPMPKDIIVVPDSSYGIDRVSIQNWNKKDLQLPNFNIWMRFEMGGLRTRIEFLQPK